MPSENVGPMPKGLITSNRPRTLVLATGTGTEIGKTWWGEATLTILRRRGFVVAARKPAQSGTTWDASDARRLADACAISPENVCFPRRTYGAALAPPMAAQFDAQPPFTIAELVAESTWPPETDIGWLESAGGVRSPLAIDGDTVDLARVVMPDITVVVSNAELGCINSVRLTADALKGQRLVIALNWYVPDNTLHQLNCDWLTNTDHFRVVTRPDQLAEEIAQITKRR